MDNILFKGYIGSQLHGTNTDESDVDTITIIYDDIDSTLGLKPPQKGKQNIDGNDDSTVYALKHWMRLLLAGNSNAVTCLNIPQDKIIFSTPDWNLILLNRLFLIGELPIYNAYKGVCYSELTRWEKERDSIKAGKNTANMFRYMNELTSLYKTGKIQYPMSEETRTKQILMKQGKAGFINMRDVVKTFFDVEIGEYARIKYTHQTPLSPEPRWDIANQLVKDILLIRIFLENNYGRFRVRI